jgi:hypothetical protein
VIRWRITKICILLAGITAILAATLATSASAATASSGSPPPSNKVNAPPTDLKDYPKQSAPTIDPAAWGTPVAQAEVVAMSPASNGTANATIYTGVPGESVTALYDVLKSSGVAGLVSPVTSQVSPQSTAAVVPNTVNHLTSCSYGTAKTFLCGTDNTLSHQIRWADGCCAHPQVWFVDHTGSQWPVTSSTYEWNTAHGVDSNYVWASCPGYSQQYCVNVTDRNAGCSGWQGLTNVSWNSTSYYMTGASVQLNDYNGTCTVNGTTYDYNKNANGYRQDACHEMGHALGMGHNSSTNSCIYGTIINSAGALVPDSNDFTLIAELYNDGNELPGHVTG